MLGCHTLVKSLSWFHIYVVILQFERAQTLFPPIYFFTAIQLLSLLEEKFIFITPECKGFMLLMCLLFLKSNILF